MWKVNNILLRVEIDASTINPFESCVAMKTAIVIQLYYKYALLLPVRSLKKKIF